MVDGFRRSILGSLDPLVNKTESFVVTENLILSLDATRSVEKIRQNIYVPDIILTFENYSAIWDLQGLMKP